MVNNHIIKQYTTNPSSFTNYQKARIEFDILFNSEPEVDEPFIVYRTLAKPKAPEIGDWFSAVFKNNIAVSTSLSAEASLEFGEKTTHCCVDEILIYSGAKVLFIEESSFFPNEKEVLLPYNSKFYVLGHRMVSIQFKDEVKNLMVVSMIYVPVSKIGDDTYLLDAIRSFNDAKRFSRIPEYNKDVEEYMRELRKKAMEEDDDDLLFSSDLDI